jgi:glycosyltransferase involved in cell wall biosynthesis
MGGIEKFNRAFMKALELVSQSNEYSLNVISAYDCLPDTQYIPSPKFKGFNQKRALFSAYALIRAVSADIVILGHINLAPIGIIIKTFFPAKKVVLITHGIEVWDRLTPVKTRLLLKADKILAVSNFTKEKIAQIHSIADQKIQLFANTLDPFFHCPKQFDKPAYLLERYKLNKHSKVMLTIARLSHSEKYKGYDKVAAALANIKEELPDIQYLLGGKWDEEEKQRMDELVIHLGIEDQVQFIGYISDKELIDHYLVSDLFIMPSKGEGFGIVFIEAMACGLAVIGGNKDGSVDALKNGELGLLVDPDDLPSIEKAILASFSVVRTEKHLLQSKVIESFGFQTYLKQMNFTLQQVVENR